MKSSTYRLHREEKNEELSLIKDMVYSSFLEKTRELHMLSTKQKLNEKRGPTET